MSTLSIILFFLYSWGFGFGLGLLAKESEDFLERNLMRIGTGLGAMLAFGLLLNLLRVPLDWRVFLSISLLLAFVKTYVDFKKEKVIFDAKKISISVFPLLMLALFSISLYMYEKGAFAYPYLEDDDSWSHAMGVKYVSLEKTVFVGAGNSLYIDPYPPAYDMLMGILHQTNDSVYWTLKFFNALIVSLSVIFFYFFAKTFTNSSKKALFSTFALFAVPAYLSHFIWAIALTMPLFFASFYAVEKIKDDKRWFIPAAMVIAATLTSSPTHSAYFGLFFLIYFIGRTLVQKKLLVYEFIAGFSGLLLSFLLWWLPMILTHGFKGTLRSFLGSAQSVINVAGTGDRIYHLSEFIFAREVNMINNPIGIGIVLSILTIIGLVFIIIKYKDMAREENYHKLITVLWFIFAFYAVNAARFPVRLSPFRAWMLLAIPVSLLSGEAIALIDNFARAAVSNFAKPKTAIKAASLLVLGLIAYSIVMTSFVQKYTVNTAIWPPGGFWASGEELQGYLSLKSLPPNTKVFTFSNFGVINGFDKFVCSWCKEVQDFRKNGFNQSANAINLWAKSNGYNYLVVDGQTARIHGVNETNNKINELLNSGLFKPVHATGGFILFQTA